MDVAGDVPLGITKIYAIRSVYILKANVSLEKGIGAHGSFPLEALLSTEILREGQ